MERQAAFQQDSAIKSPTLQTADIRSTQDSAVRAIQSAIFRGELKLGQRIREEELAEALKISRATVREALRRLEQVGLVQIKPRRGTFVTRLTLIEIERTCRLRAVVEGLAARYASERLTEEDWGALSRHVGTMRESTETGDLDAFRRLDRQFHERIWSLAHDTQLEHILRYLATPYFAFIASVSTYVVSDVRQVCRAHEEYVEVLRSSDPELVQKIVQEIHEALAVRMLADFRRAQAEMPAQILDIEDDD
jgi:DNA-binding GntR family transcriptional regulator